MIKSTLLLNLFITISYSYKLVFISNQTFLSYNLTSLVPNIGYEKVIQNEFSLYSPSIFDKLKLKHIAIVREIRKNNSYFCGFYYKQTITVSTSCNIKTTLHHELYHAIDDYLNMDDVDDEWTELNQNEYVSNFDEIPLLSGFIMNYGMKNANEDKATIYETMMTNQTNIEYDNIIKSKMRLMFQRLIAFDNHYLEIFIKICEKNNNIKLIFSNVVSKPKDEFYILEDIEYTDDEDDFVLNFNVGLANQKEKQRFIDLVNSKYILSNSKISGSSNDWYNIIKRDKLILTIVNNIAHISGWISCNNPNNECSTNIPHNINTHSKITRIINNMIIINNNKLIYRDKIILYDSSKYINYRDQYSISDYGLKSRNLQDIKSYLKPSLNYAFIDISFVL
jgi:hypothetical protein